MSDKSGKTYYKTSEIAKAVGYHPNTIRLYEQWGLLPPIPRAANGYRLYTERHLDQVRLARIALRCDFGGAIRLSAIGVIKVSATGALSEALRAAQAHLELVRAERARAEEALALIRQWTLEEKKDDPLTPRNIKKAAQYLGLTTDTLRNWELNGLIKVPRNPGNRYREYGQKEIKRLKVIRTLRAANYSLMAILRMMLYLDKGCTANLGKVLDTPGQNEDVVYATDRWLSTLAESEQNAELMIQQLQKMLRDDHQKL